MSTTSLPRASLQFLRDLAEHNDKAWFDANRDRYERDLLLPARELVEEICRQLAPVFPELTGSAAASGGSLTRLYRDVRFSRDKQPFHTHIGMHFWHRAGRKMELPGLFLRIDPREVLLGTGLHEPEPDRLARVRDAIARDPKAWRRASLDRRFIETWTGLEGDSLKRVPAPWPADHPCADDLRRRSFTAFVTMPAAEAARPGFATRAVTAWRASKPLMAFLCAALDLD